MRSGFPEKFYNTPEMLSQTVTLFVLCMTVRS